MKILEENKIGAGPPAHGLARLTRSKTKKTKEIGCRVASLSA